MDNTFKDMLKSSPSTQTLAGLAGGYAGRIAGSFNTMRDKIMQTFSDSRSMARTRNGFRPQKSHLFLDLFRKLDNSPGLKTGDYVLDRPSCFSRKELDALDQAAMNRASAKRARKAAKRASDWQSSFASSYKAA